MPDAERLLAAHLTGEAIGKAVAGAADVRTITDFVPQGAGDRQAARTLPIRVYGPLKDGSAAALASLNLGTAEQPVPLGAVATITRSLRGGLIVRRAGAASSASPR